MSELRKDPIIGRWVIISTERAKRPHELTDKKTAVEQTPCPFCEGNEANTPPEIYAIRKPHTGKNEKGWEVRVVPSIAPVLKIEGSLDRHGRGMYDVLNGIGAHEIIVETPQHLAGFSELEEAQIAKVISTYIDRINDLSRDQRFKYALLFKNHGVIAGAGIYRHCRSQLMAMPVNPKRVKEELVGAHKYFDYKERCIFCDMLKQEMNEGKRIVEDIDGFVAIMPFASRFPFEMWVMPKTHSPDFVSMRQSEIEGLSRIMKVVLTKLRVALDNPPYNFVLHTAPFRRPKGGYWKTIDQDYHWHIEIMPRVTRIAGFEWGSGFYINPTSPEEAAKYMKEISI